MSTIKTKVMTILLFAAIALSACQPAVAPTQAPKATDAPTVAPAPKATDAPKPTQPPAPTAVPTAVPTMAPAVDITYYTVGGFPKDLDAVSAAASDMLKKKGINANFKIVSHDWGTWRDQMKLTYAGNEACDIVFAPFWGGVIGYNTLARDGVLLDLTDLLAKNAPKTWASYTPAFWNGGRIDGKIYGVPAGGAFVQNLGIIVRKDLVEKYKFDVTTVKPGDWNALVPLWNAAKADKIIPFGDFGINSPAYGGYDIVDASANLVVKFDDPQRKVVFYPTTDQYKQAVTLMHQWFLAGYTYKDPSNNDDNIANLQAGKVLAQWLGAAMKPGVVDMEWKPRIANNKYDGVAIPMTTTPFIPGTSFTQNVNSICKASKNPTVALQVLELMNTDQEFYNLLAIGIEGKHWVWDDKAAQVIKAGPNQADYTPGWGWEVGNTLLGYYPNKTVADAKIWDVTNKENNTAPVSVMMGFAFNQDPVKTEYASVVAAITEADHDLGAADTGGRADNVDAAIANLVKKSTDAGLAAVIAEAQKQIDAWAATQK